MGAYHIRSFQCQQRLVSIYRINGLEAVCQMLGELLRFDAHVYLALAIRCMICCAASFCISR